MSRTENPASEDGTPAHASPEDGTLAHASPEDASPEDASPEDATLTHTSPEDASPEDATPEDASPEDASPEDATPEGPGARSARLEDLLEVTPPSPPSGFEAFWRARYDRAVAHAPRPTVSDRGEKSSGHQIFDLAYRSTDGVRIGGWLTVPRSGRVERACVVGHGYGGREGPDLDLPVSRCAFLFPCFRGIGRSPHPPVSPDPWWHVLHDIQDRDRYVIGGCVDDLWLAVSAAERLFPQVRGRVGYLGISFGGGLGALAAAWEPRLQRVHLALPTFGHQRLRLELPATGSAASVQAFEKAHPGVAQRSLAFFDAATSARYIRAPLHFACALHDDAVPAATQFAVHNAAPTGKKLFVQERGHASYPDEAEERTALLGELRDFFDPL